MTSNATCVTGNPANSNTITMAVTSAPGVSSFSPTSGIIGSSVVITGTNFTGATSVKFNGVSAVSFTVNTATQITATIPAGATSGLISVTTSCGTGNSVTNYTVTPSTFTLTVKSFIQGFYRGAGTMVAVSNPGGAPTTCDTMTVFLAQSTAPYSILTSSRSSFSTSGVGTFTFPISFAGSSYYLVVKHRNSLETWSATAQLFSGSSLTYDFTTAANKAFGNNMFANGDGTFSLYAGDINQDGSIGTTDFTSVELMTLNFVSAYDVRDVTGDNVVESADYSLIENNVKLGVSLAKP